MVEKFCFEGGVLHVSVLQIFNKKYPKAIIGSFFLQANRFVESCKLLPSFRYKTVVLSVFCASLEAKSNFHTEIIIGIGNLLNSLDPPEILRFHVRKLEYSENIGVKFSMDLLKTALNEMQNEILPFELWLHAIWILLKEKLNSLQNLTWWTPKICKTDAINLLINLLEKTCVGLLQRGEDPELFRPLFQRILKV